MYVRLSPATHKCHIRGWQEAGSALWGQSPLPQHTLGFPDRAWNCTWIPPSLAHGSSNPASRCRMAEAAGFVSWAAGVQLNLCHLHPVMYTEGWNTG